MDSLKMLKIGQVTPDDKQPRKHFSGEALSTLTKSIKKYGIKNPLLVEETETGKFLIVDGERRYRAAVDLGIKEVPVIIEGKKNDLDRIVEQFHIQEQHEGWTASEKASVVIKLGEELKMSLNDIAEILGLERRTIDRYSAFGKLMNREEFQEKRLDIKWAATISNLKTFTQRLSRMELNKQFTRADESRFEKVIMKKIKDDEISSTSDFTKLKDAFRKEPKSIEEFLEGKSSADQLFLNTKAKGAYHLRNGVNNALQVQNHLSAFMAIGDTKVEPREVVLMKEIVGTIKKFIERYE